MDRDYTTDAEEEYRGYLYIFHNCNEQLSFQYTPTTNNISTVSVYNQTFNDITGSNSYAYSNYLSKGICKFEEVRNYDKQASVDTENLELLEEFRSTLENVRKLLKLPQLGGSYEDIKYYLGRFGRDSSLYGSIFGDDVNYADLVQYTGFTEIAQNSRAYYERDLAAIIAVDENGNVTYDMEAIEKILGKDACDITSAEYTVIATAYLYMDENDIETLFCDMMVLSEKKDYKWYQERIFGPWTHEIYDDYYEWSIDDEKWKGFTQGLDTVSMYNLATIDAYQDNYPEISDAAANWRYNIVQRESMADAMLNLHEFRAPYGDEKPYLNIIRTEDEKGNSLYSIEFEEYYMITSKYGDKLVSSSLHKSNINIGVCNPGIASQFITTDNVLISLHEYYAPYFNSEGFVSDEAETAFYLEHFLGYAIDNGLYSVGPTDDSKIPDVSSILLSIKDMALDYEQGVQDAKMIEIATNKLKEENVYSFFDCDVVIVEYDTYDISGDSIYADAGQYTMRQVEKYNNKLKQDITIKQIIEDPISINNDLNYFVDNGGGDLLHDIHFGN